MRRFKGILCFCAAAALWSAPAARAEEPGVELEVGFDYSGRYIFRGVDLLGRRPALLPRLTVTRGGLSAYYEGYGGEIGRGGPDYEEHDFGIEYGLTAGRLSLTLGSVAYTYRKPVDYEDELEIYAISGLDVPLSPALSVYYDAKGFGGGYASLEVSHELPLVADRLSLGLAGSLGYDLGYYSDVYGTGPSRGWNDARLGADLAWQAFPAVSFHLLAERSIALDVMDAVGERDQTFYTVGTALSF